MRALVESSYELYSWQKVIIDYVSQHYFNLLNNDLMDSFSDYERNKAARISIALPAGSGHSTLAVYFATHSPTVLIYKDTEHFNTLSKLAENMKNYFINPNDENIGRLGFHRDTYCISSYHIHYEMQREKAKELLKLEFGSIDLNPKMVIIDQAEELKENNPEIIDWIYQVATGPIVFLG